MKTRYKITISLVILIAGLVAVGWNWESVKAATRKIVYNLRLDDGLIGYWSFNGQDMSGVTATDRGSGGNNGTLTSGPTAVPGVVGQALNFDGVNDYVNLGSSAILNPANFTLSAWFKSSGCSAAMTPCNIYRWRTFGNALAVTSAGEVQTYFYDSGVVLHTVTTTGGSYNDNQWHHVSGTYDGATLTMYVDGISNGAPASSADLTYAAGSASIGRAGNFDGDYFSGAIDEVRLYNRALSAAEVAYQYERTKPAGSGAVAKAVPNNNGLVGAWDFDDCDTCTTARDRSPYGNNGTMYNAAGPTEGDLHTASGKVMRGIYLDGSNDYINIPNSTSLDITGDKVTVEAWINTPEAAPAEYDRIVVKEVAGNAAPYTRYSLTREGSSTGKIGFTISTGGVGTDTFLVSTGAVSPNVWHHLVGVYDGATMYLYIDGVLNNSTAKSGNIGSSATPLVIGADTESSIEYTNAYIDGVRVYNRALTATEVKNSYNNTARKFLVNMPQNKLLADGLVGLWSFNGQDMSGVTAIDRSSGGNNGTLTGGPTVVPGVVGQALNFDGNGDYVDAGANSITGTSPFTLSAWINTNQISAYSGAVAMGTSAIDASAYIGTVETAQVGTNNSIGGGFYGRNYGSGITTTGQWAHVVMTFTGGVGGTATIYVNGQNLVSEAKTPSLAVGTVRMGRIGTDTLYDFNGSIDEVRLYNRALSAAEVLQLYRAGSR